MTDRELMDIAEKAAKNSYSPYSRFPVGAALECSDGTVFTGCNVENAALGSTICAERTAAVKAVSDGERRFTQLAIVSSANQATPPCGMCRQFLAEFSDALRIYLAEGDGFVEYTLEELFPRAKLPMKRRG